MTKKVYLCCPSYTGRVAVETTEALLQSMYEAHCKGWVLLPDLLPCKMVQAARNTFLQRFLLSGCDQLLFFDDDVAWEAGCFTRIMEADVGDDILAGVYPYRADPLGFPVQWIDPNNIVPAPNGLIEIKWCGAGFLRLTRPCVEKMLKAFEHLKYNDPDSPTGHAIGLFEFRIGENTLWSEDFEFMKRWASLGGKVWIDPDITMVHIGAKGFVGNLAKFLAMQKVVRAGLARGLKQDV